MKINRFHILKYKLTEENNVKSSIEHYKLKMNNF